MKKRFLVLALALALVLALTACGGKSGENQPQEQLPASAPETVPPPAVQQPGEAEPSAPAGRDSESRLLSSRRDTPARRIKLYFMFNLCLLDFDAHRAVVRAQNLAVDWGRLDGVANAV